MKALLKDDVFIPQTTTLNVLENDGDTFMQLPRAISAAELCGAVFRLALAEPDENAAVTVFLGVSAYGGTLTFLSDVLASWVRKHAVSLLPDVDLYVNVLEDLAHDIAESPHIMQAMHWFVVQGVEEAAANSAYGMDGAATAALTPSAAAVPAQSLGPARGPCPPSMGYAPGSGRRDSVVAPTPRGRPPLPPPPGRPSASRLSLNPSSSLTQQQSDAANRRHSLHIADPLPVEDKKPLPSAQNVENLVTSLCHLVAWAIKLAPSKFANQSTGGGLRY